MGVNEMIKKTAIAAISLALFQVIICNSAEKEGGLVAYWKFDEGNGAVAADSSGRNNDGKIYGANWAEGKHGSALEFDGVDDYVDCGLDTSLNVRSAVTVEAWIKPGRTSGYQQILRKGGNDWHWYNLYLGSGKLFFDIGKIKEREFSSFGGIKDGKWQHVAASWDGSVMNLYLNGKLQKSKETSAVSLMDGSAKHKLIIGRHPGGTQHWKGVMDEVAVYNRALNAEEISNHYLNPGKIYEKAKDVAAGKDKEEKQIEPELPAKNILENGGFEDPASDVTLPSGWTRWEAGKETAYRDMEDAYEGQASLCLKVHPTQQSWSVLEQEIKYEPAIHYEVTFFGKTNGLVNGRVVITDFTVKEKGPKAYPSIGNWRTHLMPGLYIFEEQEWRRYRFIFSAPSQPDHKLVVRIHPGTPEDKGGIIWIDEVKIMPITRESASVSKLLESEKIEAFNQVAQFRYELGTRLDILMYDMEEFFNSKLLDEKDYADSKDKISELKKTMEQERYRLNAEVENLFTEPEDYALLSSEEALNLKTVTTNNADSFRKEVDRKTASFVKEIEPLELSISPDKKKIVYPVPAGRKPDWFTEEFPRIMTYHGRGNPEFVYRSLVNVGATVIKTWFFQHIWGNPDRYGDVEKQLYELSKKYNLPIITGGGGIKHEKREKADWFNPDKLKEAIKRECDTWGKYPGFAGVHSDEIQIRDQDIKNEEGYRRFTEYLRDKYSPSRLKELKISLNETIPPDKWEDNPVLWTEWQYFKIELMADYLKEIEDYLVDLRPDFVKFSTVQQLLPSTPQNASYPALASRLNCIGMDPFNNANAGEGFLMELIRSASKGPTILCSGSCYCAPVRRYELDLSISCAHAEGIWIFCWMYQSPYRLPSVWGGNLPRHPSKIRVLSWREGMWEVTKRTFGKISRVEQYLLNTQSPSKAALIYSERTGIIDSYSENYQKTQYYINQLGLYQALLQEHIQVDPVFAEILTRDRLDKYRVVIIADSRSLAEREVNLIRDWVKAGGILIATASTSLYDEWGRMQKDYSLTDVLGVHYKGSKTGATDIKITNTALGLRKGETITYSKEYPYDLVSPTTAEIVAEFDNGDPAILVNNYQQGKSISLTSVKLGVCFNGSQSMKGMYKEYYPGIRKLLNKLIVYGLKEQGEELPFIVRNCPQDVECTMRTQPHRRILHFLNYADKEPVSGVEIEVKVPSVEGIKVFYPVDNKKIEYNKTGKNRINFRLKDFDVHEMVVVEY
jgi:hypothetical protein